MWGLITTDRAKVRWREVVSLKPEVGELGFLMVAVAKCDHGPQGNVYLEMGGEAAENSQN